MDVQDRLLTTEDIAKYLNVEVVTVRRLVGRGELAAYRVGGEYRFSQADLQDYLKRQYVPARSFGASFTLPQAEDRAWLFGLLHRRPSGPVEPSPVAAGERFTPRAQAVLKTTQERAEAMNSASIEPRHLLLGLTAESGGLGSRALAELGVTEADVRTVLERHPELASRAGKEAGSVLRLSEGTMTALRRAVDQANKLKHNHLGTEHLLLGLLADPKGEAAMVLGELKIEVEKLRAHVQKLIKEEGGGPA
jgi:excisionase family DNA binding protein